MFKRLAVILPLILMVLFASIAPVGADDGAIDPISPAPSAETGEMVNETTNIWFVELSETPAIQGGSVKSIAAEQDTFEAAADTLAAQENFDFEVRMSYDTLWNGFSVKVEPGKVSELYKIPGVVAIYPVDIIHMPETFKGEANPELYSAINMTGADVVQSELGFTGKGIRVAIMDTGIDYDHADLGGDGTARANSDQFPNARVVDGVDLVGDDFDAETNPVTSPDPYPDDCAGHGTHVAGIVGANGSVKGVAPDVVFGAYRVFGCAGSTTSDVMLAAMEMAYADNMDVLNMSIGSAFQWPQYPTAVAANNLVDRGVVVVASIGNSGANGLYSTGAPGNGSKVIGVASFDNLKNTLPYFTVGDTKVGYITMSYSPEAPTSGSGEIVWIGRACNGDALLGDPTGKIALAMRGTCSFGEKATNAINAGAVAVLIHNNVAGVFGGTLGAPIGDGTIPVVGISMADGLAIRALVAPSLNWTDQMDLFYSPTGGLISSFSSYGLAPDLSFKPDIGAPGGNIYSTYPLEEGGFATLSGTSMSSPHVAGAVALMLQAHPNLKPLQIRRWLQNAAEPAPWWGNPGLGYLDNVNRQGAGMLKIDRAILAKVHVSPGALALGESLNQKGGLIVKNKKLYFWNTGKTPVTYTLSFTNALSVANTFAPKVYSSNASVAFSQNSFTINPKSGFNIVATFTPATGPTNALYGGYIVATGDDGSVIRIPYSGFAGDYQSIQALAPTPDGFPWLAYVNSKGNLNPINPADPPMTFTLQGDDIPYILFHLDHQVADFFVEVYDAKTGELLPYYNRVFGEQYLGRNSTSTGYWYIGWDGTLLPDPKFPTAKPKMVKDGTYFLQINVLKALGNISRVLC